MKSQFWLCFFGLAACGQAAGLGGSGLFVPGTVAQGMGGAHAGLAGDEYDSLASPALAVYQELWGAAVGWGSLLDGATQVQTAALALDPDYFTLGLAGTVQRREEPATGHRDLLLHAAMGLPLSDDGGTALGAGLRYAIEDQGDHGEGVGLDLGLAQRWKVQGQAFLVAAGLQDLDTVIHHNSGLEQRQPQVIRLGLGWDSSLGFAFSLDQDAELNNQVSSPSRYRLRFGAEGRWWQDRIFVRAGYLSFSNLSAIDPFGGSNSRVTLGLGARAGLVRLDYAFVPSSGGVGSSHRLEVKLSPARTTAPPAALPAVPPPAPPAKPVQISRVLRGDGLVLLEWEDPTAAVLEGYAVLSSYRPDALYQRLASTGGGQRALELRGLSNGATYYFKVVPLRPGGQPMDEALSVSASAQPQPAEGDVAGALAAARAAYERGDWDGAQAEARKAQLMDPLQADAELLLRRVAGLKAVKEDGK